MLKGGEKAAQQSHFQNELSLVMWQFFWQYQSAWQGEYICIISKCFCLESEVAYIYSFNLLIAEKKKKKKLKSLNK